MVGSTAMAGEETQADVVEVLVTKVAITPLRRVSSDAGNKDRKMDFKLEVILGTKRMEDANGRKRGSYGLGRTCGMHEDPATTVRT